MRHKTTEMVFMIDDDELAELRRKKMLEMLSRQQAEQDRQVLQENAEAMLQRKVDLAASHLFTPQALAYFIEMKKRNPTLHEKVLAMLFPPEVVYRIDLLLRRIQAGMVPRGVISDIDIQQIERELLGIKSTISYKKRGEKDRLDLSSLFKGE